MVHHPAGGYFLYMFVFSVDLMVIKDLSHA